MFKVELSSFKNVLESVFMSRKRAEPTKPVQKILKNSLNNLFFSKVGLTIVYMLVVFKLMKKSYSTRLLEMTLKFRF